MLALCAGALVVGAWWVLRGRSETDGPVAGGALRAEKSGESSGADVASGSASTDSQPPDPRVEPSALDSSVSATWARVFVEGNVSGVDTTEGGAVLIVRPSLSGEGAHGVATSQAKWGIVDAKGHFRVDVSSCFPRDAEELVQQLHVQVSSQGMAPFQQLVAVPFTRAQLERGGELVIPVDLAVPALCTVQVDVVTSDGTPAEFSLASLTDEAGRPGVERELASLLEPAPESRFSLKMPCDQPGHFLAFGPGFRPATVRVEAGTRALRIELSRGATIAGKVSGLDPGQGASVYARPLPLDGPREERMVGPRQFAWIDGAFEEALVHARCESDGTFLLTALNAQQAYHVELRPDGGAPPIQRTLQAGSDSIAFDLSLPTLSVSASPRLATRDVELSVLLPDGSQYVERIKLLRQGSWCLQVQTGAQVRALSADGRELGSVVVGEGPRTEFVVGDASAR